jgi:hypothetical protein
MAKAEEVPPSKETDFRTKNFPLAAVITTPLPCPELPGFHERPDGSDRTLYVPPEYDTETANSSIVIPIPSGFISASGPSWIRSGEFADWAFLNNTGED